MHACIKKGRRLEIKKIFQLKLRDNIGMLKKRDKIGKGYESLQKLLSVQCLQVDDVIPILSPC